MDAQNIICFEIGSPCIAQLSQLPECWHYRHALSYSSSASVSNPPFLWSLCSSGPIHSTASFCFVFSLLDLWKVRVENNEAKVRPASTCIHHFYRYSHYLYFWSSYQSKILDRNIETHVAKCHLYPKSSALNNVTMPDESSPNTGFHVADIKTTPYLSCH